MIPEGWRELQLKDVIKLASGDSRPSDLTKLAEGLSSNPVYGGNGVLGFSSETNSQADDIIIGRVGEYCGITRFVPGPKWITDNALYIKYVEAGFDRRFLALKLQHYDLSRLRAKGGQPLVSQKPIYGLRFEFPQEHEQRAIIAAVEIWDRTIETVEAMIANAREQKQALMQQLLPQGTTPPKKRLPGFSGEWTVRSLDSLFQFKKGSGLSKSALTADGASPCILYGELYTRYPEVVCEVISRTNSNDGVPSKTGDLLIPASTTTTGIDLANATAILESDVLLSGDINILRPKNPKQCAPYFAYLLTHALKHKIASRAQGITIVHLYGGHLKPLDVNVPPIEEQHAIVRIIMDADDEIADLSTQLTALRQEKAALMQQLLTGKRRVKLPESEVD